MNRDDTLNPQEDRAPEAQEQPVNAAPDEELVRQVLAASAFEDMDRIGEAEDPMIYRNFSNGYGKDVKKRNAFTKMSREDRVQTVLMFIAAGLALGITVLLVYWLIRFF